MSNMLIENLRVCRRALFLDDSIFEEMKIDESPVKKGLIFILVIGLTVGIANFIGNSIEYSLEPTFDEVEEIWKEPLREQQKNAPWYREFLEKEKVIWDSYYEKGWEIAKFIVSIISPNPVSAFLGIFWGLLWFLFAWVFYGSLVHISARLFGGIGTLSNTLGFAALGISPHILKVVGVLPYAASAGITFWVLVIYIKGMKKAHEFNLERAILSVLLPLLAVLALFYLIILIA
ncbi:MAG: Yip1 family protein [Candidatus Methanofastidiosia archaeon]